jgi:HAE1 family hydrophobic/amphiphilic exporter-1
MYASLPDGFLPTEDQGQLQVMVQLPPGATQGRTFSVIREVEDVLRQESAVSNVTTVIGWSFNGSGQNVGMAFVELKDWKNRDIDAQTLRDRLNAKFDKIAAGRVVAQLPPSVPGLGKSDGFTFHLEDRGGVGNEALNTARAELLKLAAQSQVLADVHSETLPDAPRVVLNIDRAKAYAMNVSFDAIDDVLANTFGTSYVDDFPAGGRMLRVMVGADASMRATDADLLKLDVRNANGQMVPFAAFASLDWTRGPTMLTRYNGYPSLDVTGRAADGYSSGEAMAEMERLAAHLPEGVAYDWADASLAQTQATRETPLLIGLSMLAVFMVLAALYESWTIPFAVLIVVPLAMTGAVAAMSMRGLPNDIYFKIGMVTVIGLAGKNAILIVQFARDLHARRLPLLDAIVEASAMRFRPIVMTSAAFLLGVVPLVFSQGAGAESRHSLGTGVFGGVIAATLLGLVFTPVAFYLVMRVTQGRRAVQEELADRSQCEGDDAEALRGPEVEAS